MKINILLSFLVLLFFTCVKAQPDPIDTDRPDQTESVLLVPKKWLQFEAGFNIQKNNNSETEFLIPTLLSKYGLSKRIELRLITTIKKNSYLLIPTGTVYETGLDVTEIGAKISLFEEKNLLPKTSFLFHVGIPAFSSAKFKPDKAAPNFRFTMQHTVSSNSALGYNVGCEWDGFTNDPAYIYTLALGINLASKWYSYIEGFGTFKKQMSPEHNIDGGLAYFISNNFKIDLSTGFGLTPAAPKWYIALGASIRFKSGK
ncbi:MAG TPA: transporter [Chitinophagaceae bacterium]|nr:transporter [Chitinophagaceae bacterium]